MDELEKKLQELIDKSVAEIIYIGIGKIEISKEKV